MNYIDELISKGLDEKEIMKALQTEVKDKITESRKKQEKEKKVADARAALLNAVDDYLAAAGVPDDMINECIEDINDALIAVEKVDIQKLLLKK